MHKNKDIIQGLYYIMSQCSSEKYKNVKYAISYYLTFKKYEHTNKDLALSRLIDETITYAAQKNNEYWITTTHRSYEDDTIILTQKGQQLWKEIIQMQSC